MSTIVVMPGGFHPFHAGHYALYKSAVDTFPDAEVYVAATDAQAERPFPFSIKEKLAKVAGVQPGHFVQVKSPFKPVEITSHYNPEEDVLIFVRSEKDKNESPKPGGIKKDGTPAYFQPYTGKDLEPFGQHAYMAYLPTVKFGPGITSATEIRKAWPTLDDRRKTAMVMSLYPAAQKNPKLAKNVVQLMDIGMGGEAVEEGIGKKLGAAALAGAMAAGAHGVVLNPARPIGAARPNRPAPTVSNPYPGKTSSVKPSSPDMFTSPAYAWMPGNIWHKSLSSEERAAAEKKHRAEVDAQVDAEQHKNYHKHPEKANEARGLAPVSPYVELMQNLGWFISAQTAKIALDAVDATAQQELKLMQRQFNKPMLNGKTFADVVGDPAMFKNPKVAAILLKYAYELLNYIEPRIKKYVRPELQATWLGELAKLKDKYRAAVQQTSGQSTVTEFAPGGNFKPPVPPKEKGSDPWGNDDRSKIGQAVKQLLAAGNKVDWQVPGQMGHVVSVRDDGITLRKWNMPRSKMRYFLPLRDDRDDRYQITMKAPGHYAVKSTEIYESHDYIDEK